ncbi:hypothetical protein QNI19_11480 [Cytophagaceae bacterium DM2B3-1]|uniref:Lipocalin-like domain-containing protein n=1 Tax=Xanthocytophaga flava TaxID=3048013 RepID=A0AAE3QPZ4_9BACT|nr:hypothetical protein [Xanthocytophaga flavus]MDJ1480744.1 hypothetical protein [Xanthocytophaga flavus]MDJ1493556.1 hypothetical protein [Xanthocytophaga flavus]
MRKINIFLTTLCLISIIVGGASCKKSTPKTKTELISQTWKVQKAEENGTTVFEIGGTQTANYTPLRLSFNSTGFTWIDSQNNSSSGTWEFTSNDEAIKFLVPNNASFSPATVTISDLSEDRLTIKYTTSNTKGQTTNVTLYLVPAG